MVKMCLEINSINRLYAVCWFPDSNREMSQFLLWGKQYSRMVENPFLDLENVPLKKE